MRMFRRYAAEDTASLAYSHAGMLAYRSNRSNGYLDRIDLAIAEGERVEEGSLTAVYLFSAARMLRELADCLDERRNALTGRAPRLMLIAAE